ncbi:MAG: DSD1 family PLP-dependent enzyme [Anaerolineae bacterium]|jgi:D-serine deaminase-like pyridoxal phosphate-dependent protein|nr:DSD1 family PLP-dependent enzyme [Chloroflexota bacterium]
MQYSPIGVDKWDVDTPALCIDLPALDRNIARMASFLGDGPTRVRPHSKTHKCPTIAWKQLEAGAIGITCAKLGEAEAMASAGIKDILIANQVIGSTKIRRLIGLAADTRIMVAVEAAENARELSEAAVASGRTLRTLIEVDTGMGRCGVLPGEETIALARLMSSLPGLQLEGIMGYEGHAVMVPDGDARRATAHASMALLIQTRDDLLADGIPVPIVSAGGSGTYNITGRYPGVTEIQAGSYATMDARYATIIPEFEHALTLVAQVISVRGDKAVIDAGLKALTPEFGKQPVIQPTGWTMEKQSEEHSTLSRQDGPALKPGDKVELIPSHGCTTINLYDAYHVLDGGRVVALWPIAGRGKLQ